MSSKNIVSKVVIGAAGDIMTHDKILETYATDKGYDFSPIFTSISEYYKQTDLMFVDLEVPLGGPESGDFAGYPLFNCPDELIPALKTAGVDVCLTANNHGNDQGFYGMMRTLDVLDKYGIGHLGTRKDSDEAYVMIREINGIKLGMVGYTFDTREYTGGSISINKNELSPEEADHILTFNYDYIDEFYESAENQLAVMKQSGVDFSIIFMHWGTEYSDEPDENQIRIAHQLSEMGVDVIIGSHPHVVQRIDALTNSTGHRTVCVYSCGNHLSNQRSELMDSDYFRGYTEDGLLVQISFARLSDGNVIIDEVNPIPTWVDLDDNGYRIIALPQDTAPSDWGASDIKAAAASYNRTIERLQMSQ